MVTPLAATFGLSLVLFIVVAVLTSYERRAGRRLIAPGFRGWLDRRTAEFEDLFVRTFDYLSRRIITFTWYYSLHSFFRGLRALLERMYLYVEHRMHLHHRRAWTARKGHPSGSGRLGEIAEHKQSTALSEEEKRQRRERSLEG